MPPTSHLFRTTCATLLVAALPFVACPFCGDVPMDGGVQADDDSDNIGDACDPCPVDASTTSCEPLGPGN